MAGEKDEDLEIEVITDEDEADNKPRAEEDAPAKTIEQAEADEDDLQGVSDKVQARIKKLTFAAKEAERQREHAQKLREEAIEYAKTVSQDNQRLAERLQSGQTSVVESRKAQLKTQLDSAKERYRKAYEAGDADAMIEAQENLISARTDLQRVENWKPRPVAPQPTPEQYAQEHNIQMEAPQLTPRQMEWLSDNDSWFNKDPEMTAMALGTHERLVRSGVDPNSETYYTEINQSMARHFPDTFQPPAGSVPASGRQKAPVVAPATRDTTKPRTVRLTETELAIARRLGVPPEEYAAQKLKQRN